MKKILSISLISILLILAISLTGCDKNNEKDVPPNSSTEKIDDITDNPGNDYEEENSKELAEKITYRDYVGEDETIIVFAKNGNSIPVYTDTIINFYDANNTLIDTEDLYFPTIATGKECVTSADIPSTGYATYKIITKEVESKPGKDYSNKIVLKATDTKNELKIEVSNTSDRDLKFLEIGVVFYKNNKALAFDEEYISTLSNTTSEIVHINHPMDADYYYLEYDRYELIVNEAFINEY